MLNKPEVPELIRITEDEKKEVLSQVLSEWIGGHAIRLRGKLLSGFPATAIEQCAPCADLRAAVAAMIGDSFCSIFDERLHDMCRIAGLDREEARIMVRRAAPHEVDRMISAWTSQ